MLINSVSLSLFRLSTTIISIFRLVWLVELYYYPESDPTYDIRFVYVEVETCLAIIAACGPSLKPLIVRWFPQLFSTSGDTSGKPSEYNRHGARTPNNFRITGNKIKHSGISGAQSFALIDLRSGTERELRNTSPTGSEEEIMTYHGIMRTREYTVKYASEPEDVELSSHVSKKLNE